MDDLKGALAPVLDAIGLELVDLEVSAGLVRVTVDRPAGVDLEALSDANRQLSSVLDHLDPLPGRYTLEVSSPGLERPLRRPEHFKKALGQAVTLRTVPGASEQRRLSGTLVAADDEGLVLEGPEVPGGSCRLGYAEVDRARTVFEWGNQNRPSNKPRSPSKGARRTTKPAPAPGRRAQADPQGARAQGEEVTTQ